MLFLDFLLAVEINLVTLFIGILNDKCLKKPDEKQKKALEEIRRKLKEHKEERTIQKDAETLLNNALIHLGRDSRFSTTQKQIAKISNDIDLAKMLQEWTFMPPGTPRMQLQQKARERIIKLIELPEEETGNFHDVATALFDHLEKTVLSHQLIVNIRAEKSHEMLILDHEEFKRNFAVSETNQEEMLELLRTILQKIQPRISPPVFIQNLKYGPLGRLFKGREAKMENLKDILSGAGAVAITQPGVICGLGGIGKTRLAVEFAWQGIREKRYNAAFFVTAEDKETLFTGISGLAAKHLLDLPEKDQADQEIIRDAVLNALSSRANTILILDNVDSKEAQEEVRKILPRFLNITVIISSRISNWAGGIVDVKIKKLVPEKAAEHLLEKTEGKRDETRDDQALSLELAKMLDGLPIALEQAGAYISRERISFQEYKARFQKVKTDVLGWHEKDILNYDKAVLAAWQTTEQKLSETARALLRIASFLSPEPIPSGIFTRDAEKLTKAFSLLGIEEKEGENGKISPKKIREFLVELSDWCMIDLTGERFTLHRIVQDVTRLRIPGEEKKEWAKLALNIVNESIPGDPPPQDVRSWDFWKEMEFHVKAAAEFADTQGIAEPTARLMNDLGIYLMARAQFEEAEPMMRRALKIDENSFGKEHPNVAIRLGNLGSLLHEKGEKQNARELLERALSIFRASFDENHPYVLETL